MVRRKSWSLPTTSTVVGALLATLTLVNTSGSSQAANFITPFFGHVFKSGDIASASFPKFELIDGTNIPYSYWGRSNWANGSWKFAGFLLGPVPSSIAGSGTLTVNIKSGGSAPSAGNRTTADLTAEDLKTELVGVTALTGTWTSSVDTGVSDNDDVIEITQGGKHRIWRIGQEFRDTTPANHGQLHCWHYLAALENVSGGLYGVRWLPRTMQAWQDVSSPAADRRVFTATIKNGAATLLTMQGTDSGETHGANITQQHYTSWFGADTDAKWLYVQGGGSVAADVTVRVQVDKDYWVSTNLTPYDTSVSPTSGSSVDYYPYAKGSGVRDMATTGERDEIGLFSAYFARWFLTQGATDERVVRVNGMVQSGWRNCLRDSTTKQIKPLNAGSYTGMPTANDAWQYQPGGTISGPVSPSNQTSLWNSETETSHQPSHAAAAYLMTGEPQYLDLLIEQASGGALYLPGGTANTFASAPITGSCFATGASNRNYVVGATTYRNVTLLAGSNFMRIAAWNVRNWLHLLALLPGTSPDGSAIKTYVQDVIDDSAACLNAYNAAQAASWQSDGFYYFRNTDQIAESGWTYGYMANAVAWGVMATERSALATFRDHLGKFPKEIHVRYDIACLATFAFASRNDSLVRVEDMDDLMFLLSHGLISWDAGTDVFTVGSGGAGNFNFTPTNGDLIGFDDGSDYDIGFTADKPFAGAADRERFYVVQASGQTFKVSATQGGSPEDVTGTSTNTGLWAALADFSPRYSFNMTGVADGDGYLANTRGALRLLERSGYSAVSSARSAQDANWTAAGGSFTSIPKFAWAA